MWSPDRRKVHAHLPRGARSTVCCFGEISLICLACCWRIGSDKELTEEEGALVRAIRPLVQNADCHFLAALTALVQSILEGRTDCPISGVFGAGKTRAAAAMIGGLLVMDPTLKVMVVTKENAAHAFTKHFESLQLPPSIAKWVVKWASRSSKRAHLAKRNETSAQHSEMMSCAENK